MFIYLESCDLNPIEMVWNMLKRHVARRNPTTKEELKNYCRDFWDIELTPEVCTRFIEHNYKLVPLTVRIGGKATGDLPKKLFKESSEGKDEEYFNTFLDTTESREKLRRLTNWDTYTSKLRENKLLTYLRFHGWGRFACRRSLSSGFSRLLRRWRYRCCYWSFLGFGFSRGLWFRWIL